MSLVLKSAWMNRRRGLEKIERIRFEKTKVKLDGNI